MTAFLVIKDNQLVETVYYNHTTASEVKQSLINHDGYSPEIHVVEDSEDTKDLAVMENEDPGVIANVEYFYQKAIETGFMCGDTLETFEEFLL